MVRGRAGAVQAWSEVLERPSLIVATIICFNKEIAIARGALDLNQK